MAKIGPRCRALQTKRNCRATISRERALPSTLISCIECAGKTETNAQHASHFPGRRGRPRSPLGMPIDSEDFVGPIVTTGIAGRGASIACDEDAALELKARMVVAWVRGTSDWSFRCSYGPMDLYVTILRSNPTKSSEHSSAAGRVLTGPCAGDSAWLVGSTFAFFEEILRVRPGYVRRPRAVAVSLLRPPGSGRFLDALRHAKNVGINPRKASWAPARGPSARACHHDA